MTYKDRYSNTREANIFLERRRRRREANIIPFKVHIIAYKDTKKEPHIEQEDVVDALSLR